MRTSEGSPGTRLTRPRVLVVGQPSPGGISTFIRQIVSDPWLAERADVEHLPARIPASARPGTLAAPNVRLAVTNAVAIFRRARRFDAVHLNMAAAPVLPLL